MSRWRSESVYLGRFAGSGALNTVVGFAFIFFLMELGFSPIIANIGGYVVGLLLGFFVSKKFVFRSKGQAKLEGIRYFAAFFTSYILNLAILQFALDILQWNANFAQILAAAVYTPVMYLLSRSLVFKAGMNAQHHDK